MARYPIFPLNIVLFPGQSLPLHIFEERYKAMLQRCLRERIPFGLVLIKESSRGGRGTPHSIGTFARVTQVEEVAEGRCSLPAPHRGSCYHIMCRGDKRFRVTTLDRREAEYLVGDVEAFADEAAPPPALAMVGERVATLFDEYYRSVVALMGGWQREALPSHRTVLLDVDNLSRRQAGLADREQEPPEDLERSRAVSVPTLPDDAAVLSYVVAAELNVTAEVKQELLEAPSALGRLQREAEILAEETPQLEERLRLQYRRRFGLFGMTS